MSGNNTHHNLNDRLQRERSANSPGDQSAFGFWTFFSWRVTLNAQPTSERCVLSAGLNSTPSRPETQADD
jgi:hypothetical protein